MRRIVLMIPAVLFLSASFPQQANAQNQCYLYNACGTGYGYFRPQPVTRHGQKGCRKYVPSRQRREYYAPLAPSGENWIQYYPSTNQYGPIELNPFHSPSNAWGHFRREPAWVPQ